jgi:hypothetical protein
LEGWLPKLETLVVPSALDPAQERSHLRISGLDNACTVLQPRRCQQYPSERHIVRFEFHPWQSGIAELVEHGQLDLIFQIDDGPLPSHFQSERLYREDWVCALAKESRFSDRMSLKNYPATTGCALVFTSYPPTNPRVIRCSRMEVVQEQFDDSIKDDNVTRADAQRSTLVKRATDAEVYFPYKSIALFTTMLCAVSGAPERYDDSCTQEQGLWA